MNAFMLYVTLLALVLQINMCGSVESGNIILWHSTVF